MILHYILGGLALLSLGLMFWQWLVARRFPLHRPVANKSFAPRVTLLKPLKGCDEHTQACLRSWLTQDYPGDVQVLFAVASADDPACAVVKKLLADFPQSDAQLVVCSERFGANDKVSRLVQLEPLAKGEIFIVSDADVLVPVDLLTNVVAPLAAEKIGLVSCFYRLANPTTLAMHWEAIAINADFWSQVLQSASLGKLDFALGAVMATQRKQLAEIGGFQALVNCLADDYQLGHRIARRGYRVELCPVVVECWSEPMSWSAVWKHQLRWARTIRVCQPLPYFFSILSNALLWPLAWCVVVPTELSFGFFAASLFARILATENLQHRFTQRPVGMMPLLVPVKDLLQAALWLCAFAGNHIEWRGVHYRLQRDGTLVRE